MRLNHVALVVVGVLVFVTVLVVLWSTTLHARAPTPDPTSVAPRVVPQRPSYPQRPSDPQRPSYPQHSSYPQHPSYPQDSLAPPMSPLPSPTPPARVALMAPAAPPRAWASALVVHRDTVPPESHSPYVLESGAMIPASLLTEIHSTLPGLVIAQVTRDVYDTPSLRWVLIPRGSRLIGRYDSKVAQGEDALSVVWTRLIFPRGRSLSLPDLESADAGGTSGLRGAVNSHLGRAYLDAGLLSLVGAGAQLSQPPSSVPYGVASPGQVLAGSLGQQVTEQSLEVLRNDARMTPVITVRGGTSFLVMVSRDLVFEHPY
jgi:type IV secretory pathway VirB10-like protein